MSETEDKNKFMHNIKVELGSHPRWLPEAFQAVAFGAELALATMTAVAARKDHAFKAALGLVHTKRMSEGVKQVLNDTIISAIYEPTACKFERDALMAKREEK